MRAKQKNIMLPILIHINAYINLCRLCLECYWNHARGGFWIKQTLLKYEKRQNGPLVGSDTSPGCKQPWDIPSYEHKCSLQLHRAEAARKKTSRPVHNDNGDLSNFLFYSAETRSIHISTGMQAGGRLLPPVSYISRNGLFFFLPADRRVPPSPPCCKRGGRPGTPRRSSSVSSLSGPFRLFSPRKRRRWTLDYISPIKMACGQQCSPVLKPLWSLDIVYAGHLSRLPPRSFHLTTKNMW